MYKVEEMNLTIGKLLGVVVTIRFRGHIKLYQIVYAECMATDLTFGTMVNTIKKDRNLKFCLSTLI